MGKNATKISYRMDSLFRLKKAGVKKAVAVLGIAFKDYPMLRYFYPEELTREKIVLAFVSISVYSGLHYGEFYTTSDKMEGVVVWFYSDYFPLSIWRMFRSVPLAIFSDSPGTVAQN